MSSMKPHKAEDELAPGRGEGPEPGGQPASEPAPGAVPLVAPAAEAASAAPAREAFEDVCRERDEFRDLLLRKAAEFDNYRKRVERERRDQISAGTLEVIESLLPVLDDFERALAVESPESAGPYRDGIELIYRQLVDLLAKYGVTPIEARGTDFDPRVHHAVLTEESREHRDGEVIEQFRRGYRRGDRLIRPALVKVAKA